MGSPALEGIDSDEGPMDNFDDFDFAQLDNMGSQQLVQEGDKENGAFLASQLPTRNEDADEAAHRHRTPYNSQIPRTPHQPQIGALDGSSLRAASEMLLQSCGLSPPGRPTSASRPPRAASGHPPSARNLKRKLAQVNESPLLLSTNPFDDAPFPGQPTFQPTFSDEPDDFTQMANNFDPTAEVKPFEMISLPNGVWDRLQDEQKAQILEFNNELLHTTMTMSLMVTQALFSANEGTRTKLVDMMTKIRTEEEKHRQNVIKFRRFAEFLESGMLALGGGVHECSDRGDPRTNVKRSNMRRGPSDPRFYR
ncbi:hypothetical protein CcaverHIS002_0601750 [Cutaneotrichosporon cavernicola]|uniref:Uncharacterized protein n=1 Tax=Cutaneotrichosporon cavernicola TaxID=279322 RepID=A0AA48L600_9TREE|nr:uncharacterized protein CcaverHIS019_0501850 [Cutaneotrichosporon cavernicola]BEI85888.1 hypothetical protein CcaverHIS002_0601750 [Cutaneotrichosporon cavernicola]BEI92557.1 hypothetical protein CcaverHIS019_0501850 [Cutaneotrichosporon cavernicola]BEJ00330.1 hypothetical protein CcaverHIS631_0501870 [Cutaneotrichosporon cavernicola]BEJ08100.1 hypothetical protein CcaverHIS641_0501850 [Cutaneotrichosporon cavernicola]